MPTRPRSHQIEDESRLAIRALLPKTWVFRDKTPDYGIDAEVELFDDDGRSTGLQFLLQIKASEVLGAHPPSVSLAIEWIEYYKSLDSPVMILKWIRESNRVYFAWASEIDLYYAKVQARSFTIRLVRQWCDATPREIEQTLKLRRALHRHQVPRPFSIAVNAPERPQLTTHVRNLCASIPALLTYRETDGDVECIVAGEELRISFRGLLGAVFHSIDSIEDELVAKVIPMGIAVTISGLGMADQAAEFLQRIPNVAEVIVDPGVAWCAVSILCRAAAYREVQELIVELMPRFGRAHLAMPLITLYSQAPEHRRDPIRALLTSLYLAERDAEQGFGRSMASYSLARLIEQIQPAAALRHFADALRSSDFYRQKDYFWDELGAFLFNHHRYQAALCCYRYAHDELGCTDLGNRYADALMHSGNYYAALGIFRNMLIARTDDPTSNQGDGARSFAMADAQLKVLFLETLSRDYGIAMQKRQSLEARQVIPAQLNALPLAEIMGKCAEAIRKDALCGLAWFNRAIAAQTIGDQQEAIVSFLAAAIVQTGDDEAWLNVLLLAIQSKATALPFVLEYLRHQRGRDFVEYVARRARDEPAGLKQEIFLRIAETFSTELPAGPPTVIRLHSESGFRTLEIDEKGIKRR